MELFYFLCHPRGDKSVVCVIDLQTCLSYEKSDYALVNDLEWYDRDEAIDYARKLCIKYNLTYEPFESRYDNYEENDYLYL
jgi:enolase